MVIDAHQHLFLGFENIEPLVNSRVVKQVWLLSTGTLWKGRAGDEKVLEISRRFPDFFVPFGSLNFNRGVDAIDELKEKGFIGLGEVIWPPKPYDDESLFPYYERAEKLKMPLLIHAAGAMCQEINFDKKLSGGRFMHVYHLDIIAKLFPDLTIIGAHLGATWYDEAMNIAYAHKNVYFDISNGFLVRNIHKIKEALAIPGFEDKLLFGTDADPHRLDSVSKITHFWEVFLSSNVTKEAQEKIMGGNANTIISSLGKVGGVSI